MPDSKSPWFTAPDRLDTGALPVTEPHPAPIFDTGPHPEPIHMFDAPATVAPSRSAIEPIVVWPYGCSGPKASSTRCSMASP